MTIHVVGLINKEEKEDVTFIAKLMVVGLRAQELSQEVNKND